MGKDGARHSPQFFRTNRLRRLVIKRPKWQGPALPRRGQMELLGKIGVSLLIVHQSMLGFEAELRHLQQCSQGPNERSTSQHYGLISAIESECLASICGTAPSAPS